MSAPAPESLDNLPTGETLSIPERLIVSPCSGRFCDLHDRAPKFGYAVNLGDTIGEVRSLGVSTPIRSPFAGFLIEVIAVKGERLRPGQPVAWVRVPGQG